MWFFLSEIFKIKEMIKHEFMLEILRRSKRSLCQKITILNAILCFMMQIVWCVATVYEISK